MTPAWARTIAPAAAQRRVLGALTIEAACADGRALSQGALAEDTELSIAQVDAACAALLDDGRVPVTSGRYRLAATRVAA